MSKSVYGIDFGTSNIKIYNGVTRTSLNEKNIIAIKNKTDLFEIVIKLLKCTRKLLIISK